MRRIRVCACTHEDGNHSAYQSGACLVEGCGCQNFDAIDEDVGQRIIAAREAREQADDPWFALATRGVKALESIAASLAKGRG